MIVIVHIDFRTVQVALVRQDHVRFTLIFAVEKFPQLGELGLDLAKLRWSQFHFSACVGDSHGVDSA